MGHLMRVYADGRRVLEEPIRDMEKAGDYGQVAGSIAGLSLLAGARKIRLEVFDKDDPGPDDEPVHVEEIG